MISAPWIFVFFVEKNKVNGKWWEQWEPQKIREEKSSEKTSCDSTAEITEGILCEVPCETENSWRLNKAIVPVLENQVFQAGITDTWFHVHPLVAPWTLHSCLHSGLGTLATANGSWTQQEKERGQVANPSSPQSRRVISYSLSGGFPSGRCLWLTGPVLELHSQLLPLTSQQTFFCVAGRIMVPQRYPGPDLRTCEMLSYITGSFTLPPSWSYPGGSNVIRRSLKSRRDRELESGEVSW